MNVLSAVWSCLLAAICICPVLAVLSISPPLMDFSKYWSVTKITSLDWHQVILSSTNSEMVPKVKKENQRYREWGIERDQWHEMC